MNPSASILVGGMVIIGVGAVAAISGNKPLTPVFAGGIGFLLLASLIEMIGGGAARLAVALVGLATVTVVFVEGPALFAAISNAQKATPPAPAS